MKVSLSSATSSDCHASDVKTVLDLIRGGTHADEIRTLRAAPKDKADAIKKRLPGVLFSGTFYSRGASFLEEHSGLICADLDDLGERLKPIKDAMRADPHVFAAFTSPSGNGLKVVFRCDPKRPHAESFAALRSHVRRRHGVAIDEACKDVSRLCFMSHDPELFENWEAKPLEYEIAPVIQERRSPVVEVPNIDDVRELLRWIPPRPDYADWIRIASAVWDVLTMEEGCRVLHEWSPEEKNGEYADKWRSRLNQVHFGTLVHYARQHGYVRTPRINSLIIAKEIQENGGEDPWGPLRSAAELCANPPPTPPELITGLLYEGGTMILSGASKSHKTYTMLDAALSLAGGYDWLGFRTTPCPVLYLNLELQDFATAHRLASIAKGRNIKVPASLFIRNLRGKLVTLDSLEARIEKELETTGARLVVVDPHYKISAASGVEENSNDDQANFLYRLENAICGNGAALMIAHHFAKGDASGKKAQDRAAGGGALARWPDVVMTLTEHEEEHCVTAEFSLRNFAPVAPFVLQWSHPFWSRRQELNPHKLKKQAGRRDENPPSEVLRHLTDGMTFSEWRNAADIPETTFRKKREQLMAEGKVVQRGGCYYHA